MARADGTGDRRRLDGLPVILGLFDSGLGGLTVVRRLRALLPSHDLVFFSDQAHVPYGDRDPAQLRSFLASNVAWLDGQGASAIVMACNTSCAIADRYGWPKSKAPILDLIESAALAIQRAGFRRVAVVATTATIASGAYTRKIRALAPETEVFGIAAPALVPLVEAGKSHGLEARAAVSAVCRKLPRDLDALLLACTHYPLLEEHFAAELGAGVQRIDPAIVQAERAAELAEAHGLAPGEGRLRCVTTADPAALRALAPDEARIEQIRAVTYS